MLPFRAALRARSTLIGHRPPSVAPLTRSRAFSSQWTLLKDNKIKFDAKQGKAQLNRQDTGSLPRSQPNTGRPAPAASPNTATGKIVEDSDTITPRSSNVDNNITGSKLPGDDAVSAAQGPARPLPDLRHGLPSTFAEEFLKQKPTASSKGSQFKAHHDINITEASAGASSEGSAAGSSSGGRGDGELPKSAYETSIDRRRNLFANWGFIAFAFSLVGGAVYYGRNWDSAEEETLHPEAPSGWGAQLFWDRIKARWNGQMGYYTEPTFPKLLPDMDPAPPYTLVLSLEDLMIHSEWTREHGWRTAKRPGLDYFLRYLSQYYELVLFTSMPVSYADAIIRKLDPYHVIMWPLFREATRYEQGQYVKDLSFLNRPLSKVIIMDTKATHVRNQPENAIVLDPWKGDSKDKDLVSYIPFLEFLATMGIADVRDAIKSFDGKHIPTEYARREAILREQFNRELAERKAKSPRISGLGSLNKALGMRPSTSGLTMDGEHSVAEGLAEGKMLQDQIRERGMKQYEMLDREIRENGEKWLKEEAEMEEKAKAEQVKSMTWGIIGSKKPAPPPAPAPEKE